MIVRQLTEEESKKIWKKFFSQMQPHTTEWHLNALRVAASMTAAERRTWEKENRKWLHYCVFKP